MLSTPTTTEPRRVVTVKTFLRRGARETHLSVILPLVLSTLVDNNAAFTALRVRHQFSNDRTACGRPTARPKMRALAYQRLDGVQIVRRYERLHPFGEI